MSHGKKGIPVPCDDGMPLRRTHSPEVRSVRETDQAAVQWVPEAEFFMRAFQQREPEFALLRVSAAVADFGVF